MNFDPRVIVALDFSSAAAALAFADRVNQLVPTQSRQRIVYRIGASLS